MTSATKLQINIITSDKIDRRKWDDCVRDDTRALVYTQSWYLDLMAESWYGLIVDDYKAVLPLPVKIVAGFKIIYTPPFFQRLDIAGNYDHSIQYEISKKVLSFSRLICINNALPDLFKNAEIKIKTNYVLNLEKPHALIADEYTKECKKNIAKATNRGCELQQGISIREVITFYQEAYGEKAAYKKKHFERLAEMMERCETQAHIHLMGVKDKNSGSLIFAGALLDDGNRIYYLLGAPSEEGRKARATAFFIDQVIATFATKRKVFDFEGSDIPDVASFYRSFAPDTEQYYRFYINNFIQPAKAILDKMMR